MSLSGRIICFRLACPLPIETDDRHAFPPNIIVQCYRLEDDNVTIAVEALGSKQNRLANTTIVTAVKWEAPSHESHGTRPILYSCDYVIEQLPAGTYAVFAYEDCQEARSSFYDPQKQAFGWSTAELAGRWTRYTIHHCHQRIIDANIVLRKPHTFFSVGYPINTDTACFLRKNDVPVLQLNASTPYDRGFSHGYLLAPHILDWFYFYLLEENFQSIAAYQEFYALIDPTANFFHCPAAFLLEVQGILSGMQARKECDLFIYELQRPFDLIDLLAMNSYVERSTIEPDTRATTKDRTAVTSEPSCSQVVLWNSLTADRRIIAGRNMDGECDIRRVTVSTTLLLAVNSRDPSKEYRYINLSWPGVIGSLSGVNETGLYCMANAGSSQLGGLIKGLTPISFVIAHLLQTVNAEDATQFEVKAALERFSPNPELNSDPQIWPTERVTSELKGPICGPGCLFVLASQSSQGADVFILEGDRYGGRIRTPLQAPPHMDDCIIASNHFLAYGATISSDRSHYNFGLPVSFSTQHRYESMRHRLEAQYHSTEPINYFNGDDVRSLLQSACVATTEHAIIVEIESNTAITMHIYLASAKFGKWYAPYEQARTIRFADLFV